VIRRKEHPARITIGQPAHPEKKHRLRKQPLGQSWERRRPEREIFEGETELLVLEGEPKAVEKKRIHLCPQGKHLSGLEKKTRFK